MRHRLSNPVCHFGTKRAESAKSGLIWAPSKRVGSKSIDLMDEAACSRWTQADLVLHRKQRGTQTARRPTARRGGEEHSLRRTQQYQQLPLFLTSKGQVGRALINSATCARAVSITALSFDPNLYVLDGLPHSSQKYGRIASKTSGSTGVVALWSR